MNIPRLACFLHTGLAALPGLKWPFGGGWVGQRRVGDGGWDCSDTNIKPITTPTRSWIEAGWAWEGTMDMI